MILPRNASAPPEIAGLVFDKDGTLFDFERTWANWCADFIHGLTGGEPESTRAVARAFHYDLETRRFAPTSPIIAGTLEVIVEAIRHVRPHLDERAVRRHITAATADVPQVEAVPLVPLLDRLRGAGFVLGVATNDAEDPARAHLEAAGVLDRFAFIAGYDSGYGAKPGPGMLRAFCDMTSLAPERCAMIGDSTHDLASGRTAGMHTVGVLTGLACTEDLAVLADVVLSDIGALPKWLGMTADVRTMF